jgi:hypothetical protein
MEPQTPAAWVGWLERTTQGLTQQLAALRAHLRTLVLQPPPLDEADQELADLLQRDLERMEGECALVRAQLAAFRADLTGKPAEP